MKKLLNLVTLMVVIVVLLVACGQSESSSEDKTIVVAATPTPHGEVVKKAAEQLKDKGYKVEVREVNDYKIPNKLLDKGDVDANMFQHVPYLNAEKQSHGYKIEEVGKVLTTPMGVYSKKHKSLKDLPQGAKIYISNNPAEEGRFLSFFVKEGLIKIKKGVKIEDAKLDDIVENKKDLQFDNQQGAEFLPKTYNNNEGDAVIMNSNYAIDNGLKPLEDSIAVEDESSPFANILAVQEGHKDDQKFQDLLKAVQSQEVRHYIEDEFDGAVIPAK
ncbi:methionine ABC transporter substrate-binding protein [Staphylococcus felis]|uniref:Lipoprotein n=1 Tax=Staphylococcus felis TaxID=46127 RepID=A0AAX1RXA8_9STAP|nr:MetQ/NlpA family ABC transporter substrate-binding protein [Staphylococcus felis]MBH9580385.1 methionine ABC transporter substrate-binding protein [Staphylococcus felis]MDM8327123.1 MetQ/NlpA family ABC transporter substrate-binding protein [Staphylococcus felis]REH79104.1 methionine ABC transporter substrate-binding protein [Staphylococcus felis]REH85896.1 methionine ABC transporter substrate-binding protein [Staphylococcus felis]REH87397.1 methionine ABC transporter substrate-binding prot